MTTLLNLMWRFQPRKKAEILAHWKSLTCPLELTPCPVPYRRQGSTYDQDGVRITGSRAFIDAVLSRLTDLLLAIVPAELDGRTRAASKTILFEDWLAERRRAARIEWCWGSASKTG
jgi:hypothetical protein